MFFNRFDDMNVFTVFRNDKFLNLVRGIMVNFDELEVSEGTIHAVTYTVYTL